MKTKHLILLSFLVLLACESWSQEKAEVSDTLYVKQRFGEFTFYKGGQEIRAREFRETIVTNQQAKVSFRKGNNQRKLAGVFNFAGWFSIGWMLGSFLTSDSPDQVNLGIGAIGLGSVLISIPIANSAVSNLNSATEIYNQGLKKDLGFWDRSELSLNISPNKIGINLNF